MNSPSSCPGCGERASATATSCSKCGLSFAAGVVQRDPPQATRGFEAISRRFSTKWLFALAFLNVGLAAMHYSDISEAEATGKSFSADVFSALAYRVAGKWAVVVLWLALGVMFLVAGLRARARKVRSA